MGSVVIFVVYAVLPYLGAAAGVLLALGRGDEQIRLGRVSVVLAVLVAAGSLAGLLVPSVVGALERDAGAIARGQLWRLVTCLLVQDGGVVGTMGNLAALVIVGSVAEHLLGGWRTAAIFVGGGVLAQLPALVWQPVGAGNSVANFALAGALAALALTRSACPRLAAVFAVVTLALGVGLSVVANIHGPAVLLGAAGAIVAGGWVSRLRFARR